MKGHGDMPLFHWVTHMREGLPWFFVGTLLMGAGWLAPGHYVPWSSFQQQAVFAAGVLVVGVAALRDRSGPVAVPRAAVGFGLLALVPLLQHAAGLVVYRSDAILPAAYLTAVALAAIVAFRLTTIAPMAFVERLFAMLIAAGVASTAIALWQWLKLPDSVWVVQMPPGGRPFANVAQPNHLATLCAMAVMGTAYLFESRRIGGVTASSLLLVLGWAQVMTQSRTAWLFLALLLVWYAVKRRRLELRTPLPAVIGALLFFVVGVSCWSPLNDMLLLSSPTSVGERMAAGLRPLHWQTLWDAALRAPWFGYGWNQVVIAQQAAALDHAASGEWLQQSHNHALDLLIYNGLPLGALVIAGIAWWLIRHLRECRTLEQWTLLGALGAMLIHAAVEFPFDYLYFALSAGLVVGSLSALTPEPSTRRISVPAWSFALLLMLAGGMLSWVTWEYLRVESGARQLRFVSMRIGLDKVPDAPVPDVWLLDQPREFHRLVLKSARRNMSLEELDEFQRVVKRQPAPPMMLRYAIAAGLNGRPEEAARTLAILCRIHPVARCDEGRDAWRTAGAQYPELRPVAYPEKSAGRIQPTNHNRSENDIAHIPMPPSDASTQNAQ